MARMAIAIGKIAISRLYARAADRVVDQSLLNLVINSCKGLVSFSTLCRAPVTPRCFVSVCDSFVPVAIIILPHKHSLLYEHLYRFLFRQGNFFGYLNKAKLALVPLYLTNPVKRTISISYTSSRLNVPRRFINV